MEITGIRKQYFDRKMLGFFPMNSRENSVGSNRNRSEINGKKSKMLPAGILLPNSSDFRSFPAGSGSTTLSWDYVEKKSIFHYRLPRALMEANEDGSPYQLLWTLVDVRRLLCILCFSIIYPPDQLLCCGVRICEGCSKRFG